MSTLKVYSSLIILFTAFTSHASDDCSPVRLDEKGGSMEYIFTREQVAGTCFFEVATQLFDAYRMNLGAYAHSNSSGFMGAAEMAIKNGNSTLDNNGEGGYVCDAFDYLVENGVLNEELYSSTYAVNDKSLAYRMYMLNYQRELFLTKMTEARNKFIEESLDKEKLHSRDDTIVTPNHALAQIIRKENEARFMEKYGNAILEYSISMGEYYVKNYFKDEQTFNYRDFFKDLFLKHAENQVSFIGKFIQLHKITPKMKNHLYGAKPSCNAKYYDFFTTNHDILKDIHQSLSRGNKSLPVSINLCSNLYETGRAYNPGTRTLGTFMNAKHCGQHATVLIGRRKNPTTNRCQFLIRNSSGPNTCLDKLSNDWQCEKAIGAIWIDADKVAQSTGRIESIE